MLNTKKYTNLLFDADGTLLNFEKTEMMALKETFRKYGIHPTPEMISLYKEINEGLWKDFEQGFITKDTITSTRFQVLFIELGLKIDPLAFEADYQPPLEKGVHIIEGAYDLCLKLKPFYNLYIITNGVSRTQYSRLKATGFDKLMMDIFVSEETGTQKPHVDYFTYVSSRIPDYQSETALIIGDSLSSDIQGGINAGIDTCWYNPRKLPNEKEIHPTYEIHNFEALLSILGI